MMAVRGSAAAQIVRDPAWLPIRLTEDLSALTFVRLDRSAYDEVRYLEERFLPRGTPTQVLPVAAVADALGGAETASPRFIFHSSMCGSTLLARVLNQPGHAMALAEPIVLNQLSARHSRGEQVDDLLDLVVRLLSRPFGPGEEVVVKPGNTANNLMPLIAGRFPDMRAITIEASVEDLLRAVIKRGPQGRMIYRRLYAFVARTHRLATGFTSEDMWELTDLQVAALAWLTQHSEFTAMLAAHPAQFKSLTMDRLLGDRDAVLDGIAAHFGSSWSPAAVASDPAFSRHSKNKSRAYDEGQRKRDAAAIDAAFGPEIAWTAGWTSELAGRLGLALDLSHPVAG